MSPRASPPPTTLRGHWLLFARVAWVAVAISALAIGVFSVPSSFEHYSSVCTAASEVCSSDQRVGQPTPEGVRALQDAGLSVRTYALLNVVVDKVFQLVWLVVGALIFWRRSDDRMALLVSAFLVSFGPVSVDTTDAQALISSQPAWLWPVLGVNIVGTVFVVLFFLLFPSGRFAPRWTRWLAVAFCAFQVTDILIENLFPELYSRLPALEMISWLVFIGIVVSLVWSQIYSYRKFSSPAQRRQTKWVVFGTTLAVAGTFPFQVPVDLSLVDGDTPLRSLLLSTGFSLSFLLVPFFHQRSRAALASVRYRRPHKPHPGLRLAHGHADRTLLWRHRGVAATLRRPHGREVHTRGGGLHSRDSSPVQPFETAHSVVHR